MVGTVPTVATVDWREPRLYGGKDPMRNYGAWGTRGRSRG